MGEEKSQFFRDPISTITGPYSPTFAQNNKWAVAMDDDDDGDHMSSGSSSFEDSVASISSSSSSFDLEEDASSSNTSSSSSHNGPLYELSDLMTHLPIKRGLSKHFQGKSQSFTSLSNVSCLEDLAKKETHFRKNKMMKTCKSYGGGFDIHKTISKKSSRSCFGSSLSGKRISPGGSPRPSIHAKKSF